ncbi:MAG: hypothetical protein FWE05_07090 [Defluviitaleaceae bacterium]|nr:hypothetical protein [Defluviitaleaceae bacterium]
MFKKNVHDKRRTMTQWVISMLLALALVIGAFPIGGFATESSDDIYTFQDLEREIALGGRRTLRIMESFDMTRPVQIQNDSYITLVSGGSHVVLTMTRSINHATSNLNWGDNQRLLTKHFVIHTGSTLVLDSHDVTLSGLNNSGFIFNGGVGVDGGTFVMNAGRIRHANGGGSNWHPSGGVSIRREGTFIMYGGYIEDNMAGAVSVGPAGNNHVGGTFIMYGGEIRNNRGIIVAAPNTGFTAENSVRVGATGTFIMHNGRIHNNHSSGVDVSGTFIMYNGEIHHNTTGIAGGTQTGGGVNIGWRGSFTMYGGSIHNNRAGDTHGARGGGVHVGGSQAVFHMYGGRIHHNSALRPTRNQGNGGGVNVGLGSVFNFVDGYINNNTASTGGGVDNSGTFTMYDGEIYNNRANFPGSGESSGRGGGVNNSGSTAVFTMYGGTIHNNTTLDNGAGVHNGNSGTFTMAYGVISHNRAYGSGFTASGGGVYNGADFTMVNGLIHDNSVTNNAGVGHGGGVHNTRTFTMEDGRIFNNVAGANGGGVNSTGGIAAATNHFTMYGGSIDNNEANMGGGVHTSATNQAHNVFTMHDGMIMDNTAILDGGGVSTGGTLFIHGGQVYNNTAHRNGGGIARGNQRFPITITGGRMIGNTATYNGGAIFTNATASNVINEASVQATRANLVIGENVIFNLNSASEGSLGLTVGQVQQFAGDIHNNIHWSGTNSVGGARNIEESFHLFNNHDIDNNIGRPADTAAMSEVTVSWNVVSTGNTSGNNTARVTATMPDGDIHVMYVEHGEAIAVEVGADIVIEPIITTIAHGEAGHGESAFRIMAFDVNGARTTLVRLESGELIEYLHTSIITHTLTEAGLDITYRVEEQFWYILWQGIYFPGMGWIIIGEAPSSPVGPFINGQNRPPLIIPFGGMYSVFVEGSEPFALGTADVEWSYIIDEDEEGHVVVIITAISPIED